MTNNDYKDKVNWLSRAFFLDKKIKNLNKKIEFLKLTAGGTCTKINPDVLGGNFDSSKIESKVVSYVALEEIRDRCVKELTTVLGEITHAIYEVDDPAAFSLLVSRYLNYKSWDEINEMLKASFESRYVFQLHRRAIHLVKLPKESA